MYVTSGTPLFAPADMKKTYSGLFLVTVNPYCPLPIYTREYINMYRGRSREETKPHIFAMADEAFRNLVDEGANQSSWSRKCWKHNSHCGRV